MHDQARDWVRSCAADIPAGVTVIEIGSRDINGTVRDVIDHEQWIGLDLHEGPCVDVVASALDWSPDEPADVVVCCEVFEHTDEWREIIAHLRGWLKDGGRFVMTAAGPGRHAHSAIDGGRVKAGEYYGNVDPYELQDVLKESFSSGTVDVLGADVRAVAVA